MSHRHLVASSAAAVVGLSLLAAAPAEAANRWQTLSTVENARFQTCKVPTADGNAWSVKLRVRNGNGFWVQARATVLEGTRRTSTTWSSGRVPAGDTAQGSVRAPRGDRWRLEHTFGAEGFGGGGVLRVAEIGRC